MLRAWTLGRATILRFIADEALSHGAAIAYYAVFSLAPVLVIVIALAGLVFGRDAAQDAIFQQFSGLMGPESADLLQQMILSAAGKTAGIIASLVGAVTLIVTASGVFGEMQSAMNGIWKATPEGASLSVFLRARLTSLGLVFALGFLLIVSLGLSALTSAASDYLKEILPALPIILGVLDIVFSLTLLTVVIGAIYKFLPDTPVQWRDVGIGALLTAIMLSIGKFVIGLYIGSSAVASSYGAASALVIILLWIYYCAQIFLLGAEFTYVFAHEGDGGTPAERDTVKARRQDRAPIIEGQ
jgi:membrane protein